MSTSQRSFYAVWLAQLLAMVGFGVSSPFLPLFVQELGVSDLNEIEWWSGFIMAAQGITLIFASPLWGAVADRYGRKVMVERAMYGGAILIIAQGMSRTVVDMLVLRGLQGFVTGVQGATAALTAAISPKEKVAGNLGLLQTATFAGSALGPFLGGLLAESLGYRAVFYISGLLMFVGGVVVTIVVRERFTPASVSASLSGGFLRTIWFVLASRQVLAMNVLLFAVQAASFGVQPIVTLFIQEVTSAGSNVPSLTGIVFGASAVSGTIAAVWVSRHADRWGYRRVLVVCAAAAALLGFPQGYFHDYNVFFALRVLQGGFMGAIVPVANACIARHVRPEHRGVAFGLSTSSISLGFGVGPLMLAAIAVSFGLSAAFLFVGGIIAVVAIWIFFINLDDRPRLAVT